MCSNERSYSNPIYELIDISQLSVTKPLMIEIEQDYSKSVNNANQIPLLLLANCLVSPPSNRHNYVNQRIGDLIDDRNNEENFNCLYARPRKRCITLENEPVIIPAKTSRHIVR